MRPAPQRPRGAVVRRRIREPQVMTLPEEPERPSVPNVRRHAQIFVLALAAIAGLGALLLASSWTTASGEQSDPADALFIAVSASAVTGLVTVDTGTHWNWLGQAVILILIQVGGLGFMVGASLLLQILRREASLRGALLMQDGAPSLSVREVSDLSRAIIRFTLVVEAVGAVALTLAFWRQMPLGEAAWQGVFHAVSAFCNAGFDLQGGFRSLIPYQTSIWVNLVVIVLVQAGALSYLVLADVTARRRWTPLSLDTKLVLLTNAVMFVASGVVFLFVEWNSALAEMPAWSRPLGALFQGLATRTAGFTTAPFAEATTFTVFAWIGIMLVGGASGSTTGGVKLTTVAVVAAAVTATLRGQTEPQLFGRRLITPLIFRAMTVITLFVLLHFTVAALLAVTEDLIANEHLSFLDLMFEAMSAVATVGLSTGITPDLSTAGKLLLCVAMFVGRLGPLTVVYALQRRQTPVRYRYPEEAVRIG